MGPILIAAALLLTAASVQAGGDNTPAMRANSVAELMQRKQELLLREQLAKEGRWDEIRQMDEEQARRLQAHRNQSLKKLNEELAREGPVDAPAGGGVGSLLCDPVRTPGKQQVRKEPEADGAPLSRAAR